ncbi:ATP-binding cassette domain-containing protein, partial [Devosia sp.]|uniref:ATP-binding cassette domain-containing protein n=1 Tax=Devosia sp. TaxID=1871048 RepID=UPI0037BF1508
MSLAATVPHEAWNPVALPSLRVEGVTVVYPNGNVALREASFSLGAGTIAGLVGVNGSGKSTLFKSIMGFVRPSAGRV